MELALAHHEAACGGAHGAAQCWASVADVARAASEPLARIGGSGARLARVLADFETLQADGQQPAAVAALAASDAQSGPGPSLAFQLFTAIVLGAALDELEFDGVTAAQRDADGGIRFTLLEAKADLAKGACRPRAAAALPPRDVA